MRVVVEYPNGTRVEISEPGLAPRVISVPRWPPYWQYQPPTIGPFDSTPAGGASPMGGQWDVVVSSP